MPLFGAERGETGAFAGKEAYLNPTGTQRDMILSKRRIQIHSTDYQLIKVRLLMWWYFKKAITQLEEKSEDVRLLEPT